MLIGILLTIVAVFAHRFLPDRRLTLDTTQDGAVFYLTNSDDPSVSQVAWVDIARRHFKCHFFKDSPGANCGFGFGLAPADAADRGVDLSGYRTLNLTIHYAGPAHYLRVAIRNFDTRFSNIQDSNSSKFNSLNIQPRDLEHPLAIDLHEFTVPEWWVRQYDLPRHHSQTDLSNAIAFAVYLQGEPAGSDHQVRIDKVVFSGDWISAEHWYLGVICVWLLIGAAYGATQLVKLRRKHREQRRTISELQTEKDKYQKLSTIDALTKVMNRHGIEQFIETQKASNLPTSVIVIDLDYFKRVNDNRGHYDGDRVLGTVGELLRMHSRNTDGLGRWGGEEFVLVCPGASLSKAADLAEKLRQRIMHTTFIPENPLKLTASFGVATAEAGANFDDAFRQADQALYLAKSRGRNCVVAAGDEQMHKVTGARKGTWALISGRFRLHRTDRANDN